MLTSAVFSDMGKAFDCVCHETLTLKLQDVGASKPVIQWFCNYPNDTRQVVRIYSTLSEPLPIICGVPQEYVLGPLLFSIYTNVIPSAPQKCSVQSYVYDTKLVISFKMKDAVIAFADLKDDLHAIGQPFLFNRAKLNLWCLAAGKCIPDWSLPASLELVPEQTAKDFGVILDTNLTYDEEIAKAISSCMSCLSQISLTRTSTGTDC